MGGKYGNQHRLAIATSAFPTQEAGVSEDDLEDISNLPGLLFFPALRVMAGRVRPEGNRDCEPGIGDPAQALPISIAGADATWRSKH